MKATAIAGLILSLMAAGLFLFASAGKGEQKVSQGNNATVVFGVS